VTPPERADRAERLLDELGLGVGRLPYAIDRVLELMGTDKKHAAGQLRWVLPTADGTVVRADVPTELVRETISRVLADPAPVSASAASGARGAGR
jgi:3-dehydroquinate synthetase